MGTHLRPKFSLVDEPWIPVLLMSGEQVELGLCDLFTQAHVVREVADTSPLVVAALHRFLLAVLHRVYGPPTELAWEELWGQPQFEHQRVVSYLRSVEPALDLFSAERPFYQSSNLPEQLAGPVRRLVPDQASGRQASVWDHHQDDEAAPVTPAVAARWLITHHAFCLAGRCGNGRQLEPVSAGPLVNAALFMPFGETLRETLLLNALPYAASHHLPVPAGPDDAPAWEATQPLPVSSPPRGYLDMLTWQTRAVRLVAEPDGGGWLVGKAVVTSGRRFPLRSLCCDPMMGYQGDERVQGSWRPVRVLQQRSGLDYAARVLQPSAGGWRRPRILDQLAHRAARGVLPAGAHLRLMVLGLASDRARVADWCHERCTLAGERLADVHLLGDLEVALSLADRTGQLVQRHLSRLGHSTGTTAPRRPEAGGWPYPPELLLQRLSGSVDERSEALRWWSAGCWRQAWQAWDAGRRAVAGPARAWRREALLQERMAAALRREIRSVLGDEAVVCEAP